MEKQPNVLVENKNGLGIITLNRIKALNALSLDMVNTIQKQLNEWKNDPTVFLVYIHSASEKAFCTGGDIKALYEHAIKEDYEYTAKYLSKQYLMDYTIHTYEKPILVYINGYIMGGGVGLAIGGSYRIVTEQTKLAMPEIQICFIPDVGASYFLNQLPGAVGTYLGLTGRTIDGNDSLFLGIADYYIHSEKWKELEKIIKNKKWKNKTCKDELTQLLEQYETIDLPESTIEEKIDVIETNFSFDEIEKNDNERHGYFTCIVDAGNPELALQKFRKRILVIKENIKAPLFKDIRCIFVEDIVEISDILEEAVVTRFQSSKGPFPKSKNCSLPTSDTVKIKAYQWTRESEVSEDILEHDEEYREAIPFLQFA